MKVYNQAGTLADPNQLEIPFNNTPRQIAGVFTSPRGSFVLDSTRWVFFGVGQFIMLEEDGAPDSGNGMKMICRVTSCESVDGLHTRVFYEVDYLRTYYSYYITNHTQSTAKIDAFANGAHMIGCSNSTDWDKWRNYELPVTGNYTTTTTIGYSVDRVTTANTTGAFLVIYKCCNRSSDITQNEAPGVSAVLYDYTNLNWLLRMLSTGDYDGNLGDKFRPSVLMSIIQGVYFLPGVSINMSAGTTTLAGVNPTKTGFYIEWFNPDSNAIEYIDGVTGKVLAANTGARDILQIAYQTTGGYAHYSFAHNITITLNDFRDLYYKAYKLYAPYIGLVDVPVKLLCSYGTPPETLLLGFDYIFNIYEGTISYKWTALPGIDVSSWHPLPQIPLSTSNAQFVVQQNNEKLAISNISNAISGVAGVAAGNIGAGVNAVMNIGSAIARNDIANNAAAADAVRSTSLSGFEGYSFSTFYLTTTETETAGTFTDYMQEHGYPMYIDPTFYAANYRAWLDIEYWIPDGGYYINIADKLKAQVEEMKYVYIKGA